MKRRGVDAPQMEIGLHANPHGREAKAFTIKLEQRSPPYIFYSAHGISMPLESYRFHMTQNATRSDGTGNGWQHPACDAYGGLRFLTHTTDKIKNSFRVRGRRGENLNNIRK